MQRAVVLAWPALLMRPAVILIPGNMCDARLWDGGAGILRRALADHGLAIIDADTTRDATIEAMALRALAASDGPILPVGFSMGAIVALAIAQLAPDRISGMALFGLNAGADLPERATARQRQQAEVRNGGLERILVEELKPNYLAAANRHNEAMLELVRDMGMALGPQVFISQSEALRTRTDLRPVLDTTPAPVLLGCGEEDGLCPPAWHQDWAARLADGQITIFAGAGHLLPLEAPQAFADTLIAWINERDFA